MIENGIFALSSLPATVGGKKEPLLVLVPVNPGGAELRQTRN